MEFSETDTLVKEKETQMDVTKPMTIPLPAPTSTQPVTPVNPESEKVTKPLDPKKVFEIAAMPLSASEMAYACVLIPRFSDHYLTGDITKDLALWMKDICISYGWRLEAIVIRPGYVQWTMTVPLDSNPARCIRVMRHTTSQKIFEDYPRFKKKNLSPDFWAPGFSIVSANQPQSLDDVNTFILQIRRQQGIL